MSPGLLEAGSAIVVFGIVVVLMVYLYVIGGAVRHIADTLDDKIAAGASEVAQHAAAIAPAAGGLTAALQALARRHRTITR
jgi:hypothetical protein